MLNDFITTKLYLIFIDKRNLQSFKINAAINPRCAIKFKMAYILHDTSTSHRVIENANMQICISKELPRKFPRGKLVSQNVIKVNGKVTKLPTES